ncbi:MAG: response regulator transcription factor [Propionibacteriaceae bacterium]|nr:response regulator transcription factor [Propionibacteriaceae bacterium]
MRVLLADDQALVRQAFALMLSAEDDIEVVGQASDGAEAVEATRRLGPDVVLMDVRMPGMDGIAATAQLADHPAGIIILTTFDSDDYLFDALSAGAAGFLLKNAQPDQLVAGIRAVAEGHALLAPEVTRRVIEARARQRRPRPMPSGLTAREIEVWTRLAHGRSNSEIAADLFLSEATVKTHVSNLLTKLGVRDRVQAVIAAYESGLIQPRS